MFAKIRLKQWQNSEDSAWTWCPYECSGDDNIKIHDEREHAADGFRWAQHNEFRGTEGRGEGDRDYLKDQIPLLVELLTLWLAAKYICPWKGDWTILVVSGRTGILNGDACILSLCYCKWSFLTSASMSSGHEHITNLIKISQNKLLALSLYRRITVLEGAIQCSWMGRLHEGVTFPKKQSSFLE